MPRRVRIPRPKECPPGTKILKNPWENVTFKFWIGSGTFALDRFRGLFYGKFICDMKMSAAHRMPPAKSIESQHEPQI